MESAWDQTRTSECVRKQPMQQVARAAARARIVLCRRPQLSRRASGAEHGVVQARARCTQLPQSGRQHSQRTPRLSSTSASRVPVPVAAG